MTPICVKNRDGSTITGRVRAEVLVLDDGFSWQSTHYGSLSAVARKITGTPWSGPLFFGLKQNRPAARRSAQLPYPAEAMESGDAAR
jgi:hypothetical protein